MIEAISSYPFTTMDCVAGFIWVGCMVWLFMKVRDFNGNR